MINANENATNATTVPEVPDEGTEGRAQKVTDQDESICLRRTEKENRQKAGRDRRK